MHVAVSIVGYRNPGDVARCLAALVGSTHGDFEVVVCENGGADACAALRNRLPDRLPTGQAITLFEAPDNLGYAGGVNRCIAASPKADAWWILNPDTEAEPDALQHLVARLAIGDCDGVGGVVYFADGRVQSYGGLWKAKSARAVSIGYGRPSSEAPRAREVEAAQNYLNGASMLVSRRFVETTGPMREDYFLYCEEVEWCLRAIRRGHRLGFAPQARVLHHQGTTMGDFGNLRARGPLSIHLSERNKINLTRDCFPRLTLWVIAVSLPLLLYRFGRRRAWRQCLYGARGWWAGIRAERGPPRWLGVRPPSAEKPSIHSSRFGMEA
jgi:N-acetylglucosaminyl-diphospho-decaprenol L-rhamnosyltransferase